MKIFGMCKPVARKHLQCCPIKSNHLRKQEVTVALESSVTITKVFVLFRLACMEKYVSQLVELTQFIICDCAKMTHVIYSFSQMLAA